MLSRLRQNTIKKAASLRWRMLFWLFAAFAGVESPLGAQEALSTKASLAAEARIKALALGSPGWDVVVEQHRPAAPETPWIGNDSADDAIASRLFRSFTAVRSEQTAPAVSLFVQRPPSAFNSRAPPARA